MTSIFNDESFKCIRRVAPTANASILMCRNHVCTKNYDVCSTKFESKHDWLLRLSCKVCKNEWAVCIDCPKFKTMMKKERQICMHRNTYHKCNHNSITQVIPLDSGNKKPEVTNMLNNVSTNVRDDIIASDDNKIIMNKTPVNDMVTNNLNMVTTKSNIVDVTSDMVITPNLLKYNNNMAIVLHNMVTTTSASVDDTVIENGMNEKVSYVVILISHTNMYNI